MQEPELPSDEDRRILALHALHVLDTPPEERFDRITRIARRAFNVPIALISLVDRERQWFKSAQGLQQRQTPRSVSFCGHALLADSTFVVDDALADPRFHDNPLVNGAPNVRFYAGQPLFSEDGQKLGTLCLMDREPRKMSVEDLELLRDLAAMAQNELQVVDLTRLGLAIVKDRDRFKRQALIDPVTHVWTRSALQDLLEQELARAKRTRAPIAVAFADVDDFKRINDEHGHVVGDAVLLEIAQRIRAGLRLYDSVGRWGGEEFLLLFPGCDLAQALRTAERVRADVGSAPVRVAERELNVTLSIGVVSGSPEITPLALIERANDAMHRAKHHGKNRVERATPS
jgi:diguanylate cyclase (GGDEF)-like protein